jgi:D-alanine-D-alanine ligase
MRSSNYSIDQYEHKVIAVISGGISSEREISLRSGNNVFNALKRMGLNVIHLDPATDEFFHSSYDIAFNCLHGKWGEDGGLQGYCEVRQIPYTGPGIKATTVGLNKPLFKAVLNQIGIPVPKQLDGEVKKRPEISGRNYFLEEYIVGKEVTAAVLQVNGQIVVLPILEIETTHEFYDFEVKYTAGKTNYIIPANIPDDTTKTILDISTKIYNYFDCKGCIRIDIMINEQGPKVIEMNTSPGITELSNVPAQAKAMGMSFEELMVHYLNSAK